MRPSSEATGDIAASTSVPAVSKPSVRSLGATSELVMLALALVEDENVELRAIACRSLARAAMRGAERAIVDGRGCVLLVRQLKHAMSKLDDDVVGQAHYQLLCAAVNAVLNLSYATCAQASYLPRFELGISAFA